MKPFTLFQLLERVAKNKPLPQDWHTLLDALNEALTRKLISSKPLESFCSKALCLQEAGHVGPCRLKIQGSGYVLTEAGRKVREDRIKALCEETGRDWRKVV